ncbi:hypothetical protein L0U88_11430 [Flavihumibacter sp. RY-1]|uniref:Uncharacterized protein n=1 Tax=Flavihumibacter fluminis TaxID=2909236 RepID=A0ABS9BJP2_9BACT|nr:hypothetical protein [Flavihumibacter fluminis]MCF1715238.1 hypothetical protein [Flavihumibacter fluminis]
MSKRFKKAYIRIEKIFDGKFSDMSKRMETLEYFRSYLSEHLMFPIEVCGREDFSWEEFYIFGPGDKREYESLKRTRASYTDILRMTRFSAHCEIDYGLFGHFTRIADKKRFELPLADFKAVNNNSVAAQLLEDYSIWFVNY